MTRNKRSSEEWFSLIQECRTSGLSVKDFCKNKGIHSSNFYYWVKRQRSTDEAGFLPVAISKHVMTAYSQQMVEIVYPNGVSLRFSSEVDIRMLSQLIRL
jgi:transposase-like protein